MVVYTPEQAQTISKDIDGFCAVGKPGPSGLKLVKGFALQGYKKGIPVIYCTSGRQRELAKIYTKTVIGMRYVEQPIENCLHYGSEKPGVAANRTFCNDYIFVDESHLQGYGVFANKDIKQFEHILVESPLITLSRNRDIAKEYEKLSTEEKEIFNSLHGWSALEGASPVDKIWNANKFELLNKLGLFGIASNFNHACHAKRNTEYTWDPFRGVMTFTATKAIVAGEEVLISYSEHRHLLLSHFGFICHCGACEDEPLENPAQYR